MTEPKPTAAPPFIHLVAGPTPDPADVAVSDAARAVLIAKGYVPPLPPDLTPSKGTMMSRESLKLLVRRAPILSIPDEAAGMYDRLRLHTGSPADKLLIFAKDRQTADAWAVENEFNRCEVTYITNYVQLRTIRTKAFPRVFLDGWRAHPQARSITAELVARDKVALPDGWRP